MTLGKFLLKIDGKFFIKLAIEIIFAGLFPQEMICV